MATALRGAEPTAGEVAGVRARAVVVSLGRLTLAPTGARVYAVTGGLELGRVGEAVLGQLGSAGALLLNTAEAASLTGLEDPQEAGLDLARHVDTVVMTMGGDGALGVRGKKVAFAPAPDVEVLDATGAGDLFTAAYVWADLSGASLENRLAWAALYAGLSVRAPTAYAGAAGMEELLSEGASRGLSPPRRF